jgi:uncharacterized protein (DUF1015 family)
MANVHPFRPWRYTAKAGPIGKLATEPYDTIPPDLEADYRAAGPHNLVHLILPGNDYAAAAARLDHWIADGILAQDPTPALYVYEQRFCLPGTSDPLVRRAFIGLGDLEPYGPIVHRHERTLRAPVADRLDLLRHTRAQFGSIFMMYPDPDGAVDRLLVTAESLAAFTDHQATAHTLACIDDPVAIGAIQSAMEHKPLVIVDGHHRYEAALQYTRETRVMMAFVSLHSPGLRTLAAHRVVSRIDTDALLPLATRVDEVDWPSPPGRVRFGVALPTGLYQLEFDRPEGALNLSVLHDHVLRGTEPESITPVRGIANAIARVASSQAQAAFLVEPLDVADVARLSLAGATLPQKSTDFYPKLASGLTIYRFDD